MNAEILSASERNKIISRTADYTSLSESRILIDRHDGYLYSLNEDLDNPQLIALGSGNGLRNLTKTTSIKYIISCSVLSGKDTRIMNLKLDAMNGVLSEQHNHQVGQWLAVAGNVKGYIQ